MLSKKLNDQFSSDRIRFESTERGLTRCIVNHPTAAAEIYLEGAHVTHYQPDGTPPILWMSSESEFVPNKAIRGGIPICWPWFGPHPSDSNQPQHGFARINRWNVRAILETEPTTEIIFGLTSQEIDKTNDEHTFDLRYRVSIGQTLTVELSVTNTGANSMLDVGAALHTYFLLQAIEDVTVEGLAGVPFIDKLTQTEQVEQDSIRIAAETDRVYYPTAQPVRIVDVGHKRVIQINSSGSRSTVLWNPWVEKSKRMADFPDAGFEQMVCVETANALRDTRDIGPGETHILSQTIAVVQESPAS